MKIMVIAMLLLTNLQLFAQREKEIKNNDIEGFYITASDFKANKLTMPTDNNHKGDKIKLKQFFISPEIISVEQGKETVYYKDSVFAIRLSNGENYRFVNRTPCLVADTSYLIIYTYETTKTEYKMVGATRRSKEVPVTYYYFSVQPHDKVFTLTMDNVRREVLVEPKLHTAVCNKFTNDNMLTETNPETGRFKINEFILEQVEKYYD